MKSRLSPIPLALCALAAVVLVGCGTTTTVKLTGTPGTQVSGHYRATHVSSDFSVSGAPAWQMNFGNQTLEEFEFQKTAVGQSVALEIRRGRRLLVRATSEPGTRGLRVSHANGWKVEALE